MVMELNEIKKSLYKENPRAVLRMIRKSVAYYSANLVSNDSIVQFQVPIEDMGDADFLSSMDSKLLIRWITI
jgi:hypothetical protein